MESMTIGKRVEVLEIAVQNLSDLPARVASLDGQLLQFREEVRGEFSAVRAEMRAGDQQTRDELRTEMRAMKDELGTDMRVLHEEVLERIAVLGEGRKRPGRKRR